MWWMYALLTALFAKIGIKGINGDVATAVRTVVILLIAWGIVISRGLTTELHTLSRTNLLFLILSGTATGLSWIFYFKALQLGNVSQVAPVDKLSVAFAILLAAIFLKEALTWKVLLGAGLIIGGSLVLIL